MQAQVALSRHMGLFVGVALALHGLLLAALSAGIEQPSRSEYTVHRDIGSKERLRWRWIAPPPSLQPSQDSPLPHPGTAATQSRPGTKTTINAPEATARHTPPRPRSTPYLTEDISSNPTDSKNTTPPSTAEHGTPASTHHTPYSGDDARPAVTTPLNLQLPRTPNTTTSLAPVRSQALNDPRSNVAAPRLEDRIANVTTRNDQLQVEDRGYGKKRVRMNGHCIDVYQARISQIDPMNDVSSRAASALKPCE